ncbi:hypothetical protein pb186bvf_012133 [Paramecium bursaria]
MNQKNKGKKTVSLINAAPFQMNPHHPPLTASKTLHYPLPVDRHVKPRLLNLHLEQATPMIVFSDLGIPIEEIGWGGWSEEQSNLDPWDEALINEDITKLEELNK